MPAMVLGGRRLRIAADDLPLPSVLGAGWHGGLLAFTAVDLAAVQQLDGCGYRTRYTAYLSTYLGCLAGNCLLHVWTYCESRKGALFQTDRRWRVSWLVLSTAALYTLTIGVNAYGTWLLHQFPSSPACAPPSDGAVHLDHRALFEFVVIATWASLSLAVLATVITFSFFPVLQAASGWLGRLLCCCCCCYLEEGSGLLRWRSGKVVAGGGGQGVSSSSPLTAIAEVFTYAFGGVDMTFSDHLAALTLVGVRHHYAKPALTYAAAPPPDWLAPRGCGSSSSDQGGSVTPASATGAAPPSTAVLGTASEAASDLAAGKPAPPVLSLVASGALQSEQSLVADNGLLASAPAPTASHSSGDPASRAPDSHQLNTATAATTTTTTTTTTSEPRTSPAGDPAPSVPLTGCNGDTLTTAGHAATAASVAVSNGLHTRLPECSVEWPVRDRDPIRCGERAGDASVLAGAEKATCRVALPGGEPLALPGRDGQAGWDGSYAEANADEEVVEEALHYMRFAMAVYGWKMYLWLHRQQVTRCCDLCWGRGCGCCRQTSHFIRSKDPDAAPAEGCCSPAKLLEREAITQMTGVPDTDILHVCYASRVGGLLPHYVALDRARRAVVVAVRGSMSAEDAVTDLLCDPAELELPGVAARDPATGRCVLWAHRGMLGSARAIAADLARRGVLDAVLRPWPRDEAAAAAMLRSLPERARGVARRLRGACAGWRVVITGHSLGGGVTGLLGPLLRSQFPDLRCWAFAPPAGLMSPQAAELTRAYCVSVVHAKDMISRLGVGAMEQLMQELVHAAAHCAISKATVLGGALRRGPPPAREALFTPTGQLSERQRGALLEYSRSLESRREGSHLAGARNFVPPGHVLYLERRRAVPPQQRGPHVGQQRQRQAGTDGGDGCLSCCGGADGVAGDRGAARYVCRWIRVEDLVGRGLVVSRSMFTDHLPDVTLRALQKALDQMREARGGARGGLHSSPAAPSSDAVTAAGALAAPLPASPFPPRMPEQGRPSGQGSGGTEAHQVVLTVLPEQGVASAEDMSFR